MNLSLKIKIYLSFFLLVALFVVNGIFAIIHLKRVRDLSHRITYVVNPALQKLEDLNRMMIESKMYSTNWVYLRANQADKDALLNIHNSGYRALKTDLNNLSHRWQNKKISDSLQFVLKGFEAVLDTEKNIIGSLQKFNDYDDPVLKLQAELLVEDAIIPQTTAVMASLERISVYGYEILRDEQANLERFSRNLRMIIVIMAVVIFCTGFLLSIYMAKTIIKPLNQIRHIINDLGKGIISRIYYKESRNEIGMMIRSVNHLSEKLQNTAAFAHQVGHRNFDIPFEPLSTEDTLGKALISMRDNLKAGDERLNEAQHIAKLGSWEWDIKRNKVFWSDEMFNIFEVKGMGFVPSFEAAIAFIHPDDIESANNVIAQSLQSTHPFSLEKRIITNKGQKLLFAQGKPIVNDRGEVVKLVGIIQDITLRKKAEAELELKNKELEQKNKEMEQFAYVASHDLQEPLRTTSSFVELLHRQYKSKLDDKADKYLTYIKQSTERMKVLIHDLLDYSRIGRKQQITEVNCNQIMEEIQADLGMVIQESNATIKTGKLPVMSGYRTEIKQLFQNLVVNAIKFRKKEVAPVVEITASDKEAYWEFHVKDNGIGIEQQHSERIFVIFQRLHTRAEYDGSGIGLAHCKKIAELHGGKIWIDSIPGNGSTFNFTTYKNLNQ
ncbi:MAG TPA: ATP-binding protein [Chitinophagaceae bacterium]|nr:ATP-binding protein [Chitinophagaceae bacterium]